MEFHERLQELRKQRKITQQELADEIYVSRTAISKWESGRGFPSIDSLKALAAYFSVPIDYLLSTNEAIMLADENQRKAESFFRDRAFGLLDVCMALLLFLPIFAIRIDGIAVDTATFLTTDFTPYLKAVYLFVILCTNLIGVLIFLLYKWQNKLWISIKCKLSFTFSVISAFVFVISLQPYAAIFSLSLLAIKAFLLFKIGRHRL